MANCPDVAYTALGPMRQTVLSIATHGFIGCYGNLSGTDMESLRCRSEPGVMHQSPPPWHCRFRTSLFHHNSWFLWLWLDALLKSFCTSHWVGPRKNASNRAPHLLRPALFRQSGLFFALWEQRCRNICARIFQDFQAFYPKQNHGITQSYNLKWFSKISYWVGLECLHYPHQAETESSHRSAVRSQTAGTCSKLGWLTHWPAVARKQRLFAAVTQSENVS